MLTRIPAVNRYDIHCQRFSTMDIRTLRLTRKESLDTRPRTRVSYCTSAMRVFAVGRKLASIALLAGTLLLGVTGVAAAAGVPARDASRVAIHPDQWPTVRRPLAPDPALEARITTLMAGMTL